MTDEAVPVQCPGGWCQPRRYKSTTIERAERLWMFTDRSHPSGCWLWLGTLHPVTGYGLLRHGGTGHLAHRFAYELLVGPIPPDLTVDHLCLTKPCCNPSHMEVVTRAENGRRGEKNRRSRSGGGWMAERVECKNGHALTPENVRTWRGARICLTCQRLRMARFKAKGGAR